MNKLLVEWISKAEGDDAVAKREMEAKESNYDAICFHSQQMAEKYLKAFLFKNGVDFPKIHGLIELLELCFPVEPSLKEHWGALERLEDYAVTYRYPGMTADYDNAEEALLAAESIRVIMCASLELND